MIPTRIYLLFTLSAAWTACTTAFGNVSNLVHRSHESMKSSFNNIESIKRMSTNLYMVKYDDDMPNEEGEELAKQFYEQLKKREESPNDDEELYDIKSKTKSSNDDEGESKKKFTGRRGEIDSTGTPSAGLFERGTGNGSIYAFPVEKRGVSSSTGGGRFTGTASASSALSTKDRMMRDEINFMRIASSEATIVIQGVLVLLLLCGVLYVGASGGITDGSERFGALDGVANEFNGLGEAIDFSSLVNDDAASSVMSDVVKENSVWL